MSAITSERYSDLGKTSFLIGKTSFLIKLILLKHFALEVWVSIYIIAHLFHAMSGEPTSTPVESLQTSDGMRF